MEIQYDSSKINKLKNSQPKQNLQQNSCPFANRHQLVLNQEHENDTYNNKETEISMQQNISFNGSQQLREIISPQFGSQDDKFVENDQNEFQYKKLYLNAQNVNENEINQDYQQTDIQNVFKESDQNYYQNSPRQQNFIKTLQVQLQKQEMQMETAISSYKNQLNVHKNIFFQFLQDIKNALQVSIEKNHDKQLLQDYLIDYEEQLNGIQYFQENQFIDIQELQQQWQGTQQCDTSEIKTQSTGSQSPLQRPSDQQSNGNNTYDISYDLDQKINTPLLKNSNNLTTLNRNRKSPPQQYSKHYGTARYTVKRFDFEKKYKRIDYSKFDWKLLEKKINIDNQSSYELFDRFDHGNGLLSLKDIQYGIEYTLKLPEVAKQTQVLLGAFNQTKIAVSKGSNIHYLEKPEFKFFAMDENCDNRISPEEWKKGIKILKQNNYLLKLDYKEKEEEYGFPDQNLGGLLLYDEFCEWAIQQDEKFLIEINHSIPRDPNLYKISRRRGFSARRRRCNTLSDNVQVNSHSENRSLNSSTQTKAIRLSNQQNNLHSHIPSPSSRNQNRCKTIQGNSALDYMNNTNISEQHNISYLSALDPSQQSQNTTHRPPSILTRYTYIPRRRRMDNNFDFVNNISDPHNTWFKIVSNKL